MKKQTELVEAVDAILTLLPTEQEIVIALRYEGGPDSLKRPIAEAREKLVKLKAQLEETTK